MDRISDRGVLRRELSFWSDLVDVCSRMKLARGEASGDESSRSRVDLSSRRRRAECSDSGEAGVVSGWDQWADG